MRNAISSLLFVLLVRGCALPSLAQDPLAKLPAPERTLIEIKVTGSKRYPEDAIAAASGLQIGTPVTEDDFKMAARRLGDMGVFTEIEYSYSYGLAGTKLTLQVTDAPKFVPVRFEDFVWFSEEDLLRTIKAHAPLFDDELPLSGKLPDQVSDILQAMLVERGIPGHVDYERSGKGNGPVDSIVYRVSDVVIQIRNVEFTGAGAAELPTLKETARRVFDREYSRTVLNGLVQHQLLPIYHERGYLKAAFSSPEPKVVKMPSGETVDGVRNLTVVDVHFTVTPGKQYTLKSLEWSGNHQIRTDVLQKMVRVEPGQPADTVKLNENLKGVQKLYGSRGYVSATLRIETGFDDAAATVGIRVIVNEGFLYHMGDLEFRGLDNLLEAKLREAWRLRRGDVYNASYLSEYLLAAQKLLPPAFDWDVASHVTANIADKTVDVDLIYTMKAPR